MTTTDHPSERARGAQDYSDRDDSDQKDLLPEDPRLRVLRRLVTFLLMVLIAGVLAVVIALLLKLKSINFGPSEAAPAIGIAADETLISAEATADRITLLIENGENGARRVVILSAEDFSLVGAVATDTNDAVGDAE